MTTKKASSKGARRVTATLDSLASLFQSHHASLGIPGKVAMDFALRCDMLSDSIDRRKQAGYFNPAEIGVEEPGPLMYDENNPFMEGEFTQEEKRALSEKQMAGDLAANAAKHIADPKLASVIRKAAYSAALAALRTAKKSEEETAEDEAPEGEKDEAAQKTAMMAQLYNRLRRQAKKSEEETEEEDAEEDAEEEDAEEETEESDKTASIFGLYR
jgi:hypothetical protein